MSPFLLDANVLIAATLPEHVRHQRAADWLAGTLSFAVCPIVEGSLVRFILRLGDGGAAAASMIARIRSNQRCEFWPDDISYDAVDLSTLTGHRQVTDAYLVALATSRRARLATFDEALARKWPQSTLLVP